MQMLIEVCVGVAATKPLSYIQIMAFFMKRVKQGGHFLLNLFISTSAKNKKAPQSFILRRIMAACTCAHMLGRMDNWVLGSRCRQAGEEKWWFCAHRNAVYSAYMSSERG